MENINFKQAAQICYEAERQYRLVRNLPCGISWSGLNDQIHDELAEKARIIYEHNYDDNALSLNMKLWLSILEVLIPKHKQD